MLGVGFFNVEMVTLRNMEYTQYSEKASANILLGALNKEKRPSPNNA